MAVSRSPSFDLERLQLDLGHSPVIGIDEVGCGAWAGPVIAAAAYIHPQCPAEILALIQDSKQLSIAQREAAFSQLTGSPDFLTIGIGEGSLDDIRHYNIRGASMLAMSRAFEALQGRLKTPIACALVDGRSKPEVPCPVVCIVKGDQKSYSIAAASIVAKVTRDRLMATLGARYPLYGWEHNVGYGTPSHKAALQQWGPTDHHRATFKPIREYVGEE